MALTASQSSLQLSKSASSRSKLKSGSTTETLSKLINSEIEVTEKSLSRIQTASKLPIKKENAEDWSEVEDKADIPKSSSEFRADTQIHSLVELSLKSVISNFQATPQLHRIVELPKKLFEKITDQLSVELKLEVAVATLPSEGIAGKYWQKRCTTLSKTCDTSLHGGSWKRTFLEEKLQQELENIPIGADLSEVKKLATISKEYIRTIAFRQFPSHLNLSEISVLLPKLEKLQLSYTILNLGTDYELSKFGMKLGDAVSIGRVLETSSITTLVLQNSLIDNHILTSLLVNSSSSSFGYLSHLDISHNRISDEGIKQLISVLNSQNKKLKYLSVRNNLIGETGAKAIGEYLSRNPSIQSFDIALNKLFAEGGAALLSSIGSNKSLLHLNISSNGILSSSEVENSLQYLLQNNNALQILDISGNEIQEKTAVKMIETLSKSSISKLKTIDLRKTYVSLETIDQLHNVLLGKRK